MLKLILKHGYQHDRGVPHERVPQDSGRTVTNAQNTTQASINLRPDRPEDQAPHPADQGIHFEQILPLLPVFCAIGNKNAGNTQQNARRA